MGSTALTDRIHERLGPDRVISEPDRLAQFSSDLSCEEWVRAIGVFAPRTPDELTWLMPVAGELGISMICRGAGMSYTRSHVPDRPDTLLLDFSEMSRVLEVNSRDRYAVVQPGCTWEELYMATSAVGMRVPCWGPLSGRRSTLGGAASQDGGFFGMAAAGPVRDSIIGLEVVLSDGRCIRTGSLAGPQGNGAPSGPDLTGVFTGDSGAMGIKTAVALRLEPIPAVAASASWRAETRLDALQLMEAVADLGVASEVFAFDPLYHDLLTGLGFPGVDGAPWSVHATVEGRDRANVASALEALADLPTAAKPIDSSVPLSLRADPFGATQLIFSDADPGVHLPIHAVVPRSRAEHAAHLLEHYMRLRAPDFERHTIRTWGLMSCVADHVLIECSLYFPGGYRDTDDPTGTRAAAVQLRREMVDALDEAGPAHYQVGKFYSLNGYVDEATWSLLREVKHALDPTAMMNPSALGL